jgi:hypothetical protein
MGNCCSDSKHKVISIVAVPGTTIRVITEKTEKPTESKQIFAQEHQHMIQVPAYRPPSPWRKISLFG